MKVTEKGQVTIPKELRDALGIGAGTNVEFERSDDSIVVRKSTRVGRALMAALIDEARRRSIERLSLSVEVDNYASPSTRTSASWS